MNKKFAAFSCFLQTIIEFNVVSDYKAPGPDESLYFMPELGDDSKQSYGAPEEAYTAPEQNYGIPEGLYSPPTPGI